MKTFDLLGTTEYSGCSAKLNPKELEKLLAQIPLLKDEHILVDIETHDDAGVYQIDENRALIFTTDFFPPVCSDPFQFGNIAAANALSDVYAMGGTPLLTLNLVMYPSKDAPLDALAEIIRGGQEKVNESGAFTMGGHTIDDSVPKYGLAVVGIVEPSKLITNSGLKEGQVLILTKPLGCGVAMAAHRLSLIEEEYYEQTLAQMATLNKVAAQVMQEFGVTGGTDVTGFGLAGHALKMALASHVSLVLYTENLPTIPSVMELLRAGCIPGAAFRNLEFIENKTFFDPELNYEHKMLACDAQTSGGLLFGVDFEQVDKVIESLASQGVEGTVVGVVEKQKEYPLILI